MKFTYESKIPLTKSFLLEHYSEEQYMSYYLRHPIDKKLFCSPIRKDKNPTCSFYRNKRNELIFHDFGSGQHLNFIGVVEEMYHISYHQALLQIAKDFNLVKSNVVNIRHIDTIPKFENKGPANIRVKIKEFTESELKWWKSFGITYKTLKRYHVYSCENVFLNDNLFTTNSKLTFGYYGGKKNDVELWRIYYSQRKKYRFLTNWPSKKIQGFDQLPKYGDILIITKSMKDVMAMYELGLTACSPNSETQFVSDSVLQQLKERFKHIIVMYDNDRAGLLNMAKLRHLHPELDYFCIPKEYAKDFTDTYKKYGKVKMIEFIKQVKSYFEYKWLDKELFS